MKFSTWKSKAAVCLCGALAMSLGVVAQDNAEQHHKAKRHTYKLIDVGTLGGPNSFVNGPTVPVLSDNGIYAGQSETATPDPYAPKCNQECLVQHAQKWQNGDMIDLGTLPGINLSSGVTWVSRSGNIAGGSYNGLIDPLLGVPENRAGVWIKDRKMVDLGTLEGGHENFAAAVNDRGQVAGWFSNLIPDPFSMGCILVCFTTETRGFVWQDGLMRDLGTLGGPDSLTEAMNERGQIVGTSYTSSIPNSDTGVPTIEPFIWNDGDMVDIGTFGGTIGVANFINNRGTVVGWSNLAGNQRYHPFLWDQGVITDLGTLGGDSAEALWINDVDDVAGISDLADGTHHALFWRKGSMTDLGTVGGDPCSNGYSINLDGQVVGNSTDCHGTVLHAFVWDREHPITDLNSLVFPASNIRITDPYTVNDRGEIAAAGHLPDGDERAVILIPDGDCDDACEDRIATSRSRADEVVPGDPVASATPSNIQNVKPQVNSTRTRFGRPFHVPAQPTR
jgi:probable HAF family extracellular repeat protein